MGRFTSGDLGASIPFYVTRKTAHNETGELAISVWMQLVVVLLAWLNAVCWGLYGLARFLAHVLQAIA